MTNITEPAIEAYAADHSSAESPLLAELAAATREFSPAAGMMVGRLEGRFLKLLVAAVGARRVLEIGTFTGYSALSMAEALPPDGELISCEIDERHAELARRFIGRSPYRDLISVRVGPALDTLRSLEGSFDFVFIDADKPSYADYYEAVLPLLSERGVIAVDNVLWSGRVLDAADTSSNTSAIRVFNDMVAADARVEQVIVPIRDGLTRLDSQPTHSRAAAWAKPGRRASSAQPPPHGGNSMRKVMWLPLAGALLIGGAAVAAAAPTVFTHASGSGPLASAGGPTDLLTTVLADLVDKGIITADQQTAINDAYTVALEAQRTELEAQRQAMAEQAQQLRGFLADGVLTQAELDQLPADSPFRRLSALMTDDQVTLEQLRQMGFALGFGPSGHPGPGHGLRMLHDGPPDWPAATPSTN